MTDLENILITLKENERIAHKFFEVEIKVLTILNFKDFFEVLLSEIQERFHIPLVWIALIARSELSEMVHSLECSQLVRNRLARVEPATIRNLFTENLKPLLANTDLNQYSSLLTANMDKVPGSMALIPISLDGELIGSLNLGDIDAKRFQPGIDTSLLEQLAVKVSLCLSNVTAHEKIQYLAYHDPLTGLLNRRVMESILEREFERSRRYGGLLSVVFIDLDGFKKVNDTHGHDIGDQLLKYVATSLSESCRASDVVARFAGDEFVIILPETSAVNAEQMMERIRTDLEQRPLCCGENKIPVALSYGVASTETKNIINAKHMLKKADQTLYEQKQTRKKKAPPESTKPLISSSFDEAV